MRGYVAKKGNRWYAVIYDGINPATGKEQRRWVAAGTRRGDAEKLVTDLVRRRNDGEEVVTEKINLADYLIERWLPIQKTKLRTSTFDSYRRNIELHVIPALGRRRLDKLSVEDLDRFYATLLTNGRKDGKPGGLSPKTVRSIHLVLHKALADAHRKGVVTRNVAAVADPPSLGARRRDDIKAWDAAQLRGFLTAMAPNPLYPAFHLAAHTGMRRGEVLGLRWSDLDLSEGRLSVRQALVSVAYEVQISDVKTGSGRRTIDVDYGTVEVLRAWRSDRFGDQCDREPGIEDLVVLRPDGSQIHPDIFSQTFDRCVAKLDVPTISLHDLRHTHATLLLKAGVPVKVVSERLGHSTAAFTMTVYQHVLPGMQAEAAATFAEIISTSSETPRPESLER